MESLLRCEEMDQIDALFEEAFDLNSNLVFYPIRHHSIGCSYHLKRVIEEYKPDLILIEGLEDANILRDVITHEDTHAPFAIYYSYKDSKGYISEEKRDYKCYYPFLDYSPEYVALKEAKSRGILASFMDLSYREILIASEQGKGLRKEEEKNNYNDDYLLSQNEYLNRLCQKEGLRCFDEMWEKLFEINGRFISTKEYVKNILAYCYLSRLQSSEQGLLEEGCTAREQYMASSIKKALPQYKRILAVTGGFHTFGILKELKNNIKIKLHTIPEKDQGVYLMAYSMDATDRLNGYASGMPYPNFYQEVWQGFQTNMEHPFHDAVLKTILSSGKKVRKKDGCLSTYDEICAFHMSSGLSSLRGKKEPGAYELYDCVLASFIKGDLNLSTDTPLRILKSEMTGNKIGVLCKDAKVPPLIDNFEKRCKLYGLKIQITLSQESILEIFASERHRSISCFFHQMTFLETSFCKKVKGPNLLLRKNKNLIRETWNYKWGSHVISELIDKSVYGATLEEACESYLKTKLNDSGINSGGAAKLLIEAFEMGLTRIFDFTYNRIESVLIDDADFFSLVDCLDYLLTIYELQELYQVPVFIQIMSIIKYCYEKLVMLLPSLSNIKEEDSELCMKSCKTLYQIAIKPELNLDTSLFVQSLETIIRKPELNPKLEGAALGILYGFNENRTRDIQATCFGYLKGTHEKLLCTAAFLRGLFYTAKDLVFINDEFLIIVDNLMKTISNKEFMELLPELRYAFSYFTPGEIDKLAQIIAGSHGASKKDITDRKGVSPEIYEIGKLLNEYACSQI